MKRNILLVDDDMSLLATLGDFLVSEGYEVTTAESGERALLLLPEVKPDLIVLDMSMPGIGGMGVLERLTLPDGRTRFPVLVLTARAMMAEYFANKQVDGFIAKPCDPEDLAMEISRILFMRGGEAEAQPAVLDGRPRLLLADSNEPRHHAMAAALSAAGFEIESLFRGPDVLEAAVLSRPEVIVMSLDLDDMGADQLVPVLRQLGKTRRTPILVYAIDDAATPLERVAALDHRFCKALAGAEPAAVVKAVQTALRVVRRAQGAAKG